MRIVMDTNVIVSALVFGGVPRQGLELADSGRCEFFYSPPIQDEVRRVLEEKFGWSGAKMDEVLPKLWKIGTPIVPHHRVEAVRDDPDDNRILECALSAQAKFVVSGDRHLLRLRSYMSVSIVSPREFLEMYYAREL
ncbi:MAG TPA: putative toxin-antitoxin system toxin component, PIN family [Candidatus Sulfotelmatobacter sp.]|jgi:putative PIN family toxin of toxin-antitoxin system|nr:putative toxin-antitoxin system toxin component, PIN family [Candidatus Sulfotelmatobacter sp.]